MISNGTKWNSTEYVLRCHVHFGCNIFTSSDCRRTCRRWNCWWNTVSHVLDRSPVLEWGTAGEPLHGEKWAHSWKGDSRCLCLCCLCGCGKEFKKKKCCKDGKHFDQPVCSRCCETFPPRVPRFPSRLIKEEIALEEAMMTQGLVVVQRPLYRVRILHKKHSPKCLHQNSLSQQWMSPSGDC